MASFDAPERDAGASRKRKKRRLGVRLDMTPMVDVAFLLLTFFMLTTVFSRPQAMEVTIPEDEETSIEIAESKVLTLRVGSDNVIYQNMASNVPEPIAGGMEGLNALLVRQKAALGDELIVLVKIDREADYTNTVDILDELQLTGATKFALAPMAELDVELVREAGGTASDPPPPPAAAAPAAPAAP